MDKPIKPTNLMPRSFGGVKNNWSTSMQSSGYEDGIPALYGGDNLNYQLDTTGKELDYCEAICDYINAIPINKTPIVDANNKLVYTQYDIRVYSANETYYIGDYVTGVVNGVKHIYQSLKNDNIGQSLSNETYWKKVDIISDIQTIGRNIGEIVTSTIPLTDAGLHLLDGTLISGSGIYADFVTYIASIYNSSLNYFCTESQWQNSVSQYGVCGKFVYNSTNNTLRLPKITGFIEGTNVASDLGDLVEAGLPNITGSFNSLQMVDGDENSVATGAFIVGGAESKPTPSSSYDNSQNGFSFDASRSSSIYGNSTTVQPQSVKVYYYIVVATSTKTSIEVDIDDIATDLNGKADTDLSNVPASKGILTESYVSGSSWYRVYSDGWCEQGNFSGSFTSNSSVALLKNYKDTNYGVVIMRNYVTTTSTTTGGDWWVRERTTSSFKPYTSQLSAPPYTCNWKAYGYIR